MATRSGRRRYTFEDLRAVVLKVAAARLLLESLRPGGAVYNRLVVFFAIVEYVIAIFYRILWNIIPCAIRHYLWFTYLPGACTKIMSMPKKEDLMVSMTKMMSIIWICNVCHGYVLSNIMLSGACCDLQSLAHWTFL